MNSQSIQRLLRLLSSRLHRDRLILLGLGLLFATLLTVKPSQVPPLWFDEGWVLSLARNWVELGHYGHLLGGERVPSTILNTGLPAIAPVALSFLLFGVGPWQGRLPSILFAFGSIACIYYLALKLYGRAVGLATLVGLLLWPFVAQLPVVLVGRQAIGEMPATFYLVAGFSCLVATWEKPRWSVALSGMLWGLALQTKPQVFPFLFASLGFTGIVAVLGGRRRESAAVFASLLASVVSFGLTSWAQSLLLRGQIIPGTQPPSVYEVLKDQTNLLTYVVVLIPAVRLTTLLVALVTGVPVLTAAAVGYSLRSLFREQQLASFCDKRCIVRLALLTLVASWLAWYLLLSIGWPRYVFPATFIGSIFVGVLTRDMACSFLSQLHRSRRSSLSGHTIRAYLSAGLTVLALALATLTAARGVYYNYIVAADNSAMKVSDYLNTHVSRDDLIETYESELFFLLQRKYHYPPDKVQTQLNRRYFLGQDIVIEYDPLGANPDYLVTGSMSDMWLLYDQVIRNGDFQLIEDFGRYRLYKRVHQAGATRHSFMGRTAG